MRRDVPPPRFASPRAGQQVGRPKIVRSDAAEGLAPRQPPTPYRALAGAEVSSRIVFAANDKLYVPLHTADSGRKLPGGLLLWREL